VKDFLTLEIALAGLLTPIFRRGNFQVRLLPSAAMDGGLDTGTRDVVYDLHVWSSSDMPPSLRVSGIRTHFQHVVDVETQRTLPSGTVLAKLQQENALRQFTPLPIDLQLALCPSHSSVVTNASHPMMCKGTVSIDCCVAFANGTEMIELNVPVNTLVG
jgi:hypothetical protein